MLSHIFRSSWIRICQNHMKIFIMLSRVYDSVINNNGCWVGWLDLLTPSFLLQSLVIMINYKAHNEWLPKTRSILIGLRLTSLLVFSQADLVKSYFMPLFWFTNVLVKSQLLYVWQFTVNQFVLATSPLRYATKDSFLNWCPCGNSPYVKSSLTRRWGHATANIATCT
jgi:hypothetical protein